MKLKLLIIVAVLGSVACVVDKEIVNKNVDRTIDIASQLVKISYKISLEHKQGKAVGNYVFTMPLAEYSHLSFISIKDSAKKELKATEAKTEQGVTYTVTLGTSPQPVVYVETVFTKFLKPLPEQITQQEKQLVQYFGTAYFYSPYKTVTQKTTIHLASKSVESFTQVKPSSHSDTTITYGPYDNIEPFSDSPITVHYENHAPFLTITRLERWIEVSHWGNIAVEETIDITHTGAKLVGSFSRYDYQKDTRATQPSVKSYKTILPASATGVYYRDTNGNISTSAMRLLKDSVELDLRPRFPLFGGWRTHYTLGYNVPSFEYLFQNGENYLLKMRSVDHVFDDMVIDEVTTKIVLPEGSANIKLIAPYSVQRQPDSKHYTYLDTFGRPVIAFSKKNIVENHIADFNLKYTYPKIMMLQEPLLVVGFLYILFLFIIIWVRLDFSILSEKDLQQLQKEHKE